MVLKKPGFKIVCCRAGWFGGSNIGGALFATAECLCCWTAAGHTCLFVRVYTSPASDCAPSPRLPSTLPSLAGWPVEIRERGTGVATTIIRFGSYLGFTCILPMDRDYLAYLTWLAHWSHWCYTQGPPTSLHRPLSSRAQQVPHGQTVALSKLNGPSDTINWPSLFCWTSSSVVTQTHTFTLSIFHPQTSQREANLAKLS